MLPLKREEKAVNRNNLTVNHGMQVVGLKFKFNFHS